MIEHFLNGIALILGVTVGCMIVAAGMSLQERIERNRRYGRKWWKS